MKKPGFSVANATSAIALSTAFAAISISQASAAEFNMEVGGYFETQTAYSSTDLKFNSESPGGNAPSNNPNVPGQTVNQIDGRTMTAGTSANRHLYRTRRTLTLQESGGGLNPQPMSGSTAGYTDCYRPATQAEIDRGSGPIVFDYTATSQQTLTDCYALGSETYTPGFDGVEVKRDSEIHFKPSVTLDNGIRIGARVELEAATGSDQIDEAYISIDGAFGRVLIGSENSARYLMQYAAPDVTFFGVNSGDVSNYIPLSGDVGHYNNLTRQQEVLAGTFSSQRADALTLTGLPLLTNLQQVCQAGIGDDPLTNDVNQCVVHLPLWDDLGARLGHDLFRGTLGSTYIENQGNNDVERITWFSPRIRGLQFGMSYARDDGEDSNAPVNKNGLDLAHIADFGVNYLGTLGALDVAISGGYGVAVRDAPSSNRDGGSTTTPRNSENCLRGRGIQFTQPTMAAGRPVPTPGPTANTDGFCQTSNPQVWNVGLNLGWEGWTIGGSFAEQNGSGEFHGMRMDGTAYDAGVSYEDGPWGFSFTYFHGENVDNEYNPQGEFSIRTRDDDRFLVSLLELKGDSSYIVGQGGHDEELSVFLVGVNYDLAKGVRLNAFGAYSQFKEDSNDDGEREGTKVSGFVVGTGLRIDY